MLSWYKFKETCSENKKDIYIEEKEILTTAVPVSGSHIIENAFVLHIPFVNCIIIFDRGLKTWKILG